MSLRIAKYLFMFGLVSSQEGTSHWWKQRISSLLILPLTLLFIFSLSTSFGGEYINVIKVYQNPYQVILAILFFAVASKYLQQGLEVVIEDYVHNVLSRKFLFFVSAIFCWTTAIVGIFSPLMIFLLK
tara:strand:+ start:685 stop:1068 length:384 start_codon:yes stop_codon:yes gene_type:complete